MQVEQAAPDRGVEVDKLLARLDTDRAQQRDEKRCLGLAIADPGGQYIRRRHRIEVRSEAEPDFVAHEVMQATARSRALWRPLTRCSARASICGSSINTRASTEFIGSSGPTSQAVLAKNARRRSGRVEDFGMRAVWGLNVNLS